MGSFLDHRCMCASEGLKCLLEPVSLRTYRETTVLSRSHYLSPSHALAAMARSELPSSFPTHDHIPGLPQIYAMPPVLLRSSCPGASTLHRVFSNPARMHYHSDLVVWSRWHHGQGYQVVMRTPCVCMAKRAGMPSNGTM